MNYKLPLIRKFLPSFPDSYIHPHRQQILQFILANEKDCKLVRCVRGSEDLVTQNFVKATEQIFPQEVLNFLMIKPLAMRLIKDQFRDNLQKIQNKVEAVDVSTLNPGKSDYELFEKLGVALEGKSKIPDDEDFRIMLFAKKKSSDGLETYIVSNDKVFTRNIHLIEKNYCAIVLPEEKL